MTLVSAVLFIVLEKDTGDAAYTVWWRNEVPMGNWRILHPYSSCPVACSKWCDFFYTVCKTRWILDKPL